MNLARKKNIHNVQPTASCSLFSGTTGWWLLGLIVLRLWLVEAQDFVATYTPHDDYLFVKLAKHILSGEWLGPYNSVTLIKGPGYPLFIAFAHWAGIPLLTAHQLLYSLACLVAVAALRPLLQKRWQIIVIFFLLLMNPFSYDFPVSARAFRLGISMPLVLLLFSCMLGCLTWQRASYRRQWLWMTAGGVSFSWLWFTREEGVWLLPSVGLFILVYLFTTGGSGSMSVRQRAILVLWPLLMYFSVHGTVSYLNYKYYGLPVLNELKTPEFQSAYGGLMNIDVEGSGRYVPVSRRAEDLAFYVSPTFNSLKPYYRKYQDRGINLPESFYIWILRDMVAKSGNNETLDQTLNFYKRVGNELAVACQEGRLPCLDRQPSLLPPWRAEYNRLFLPNFTELLWHVMTFTKLRLEPNKIRTLTSDVPARMYSEYKYVTGERIIPVGLGQVLGYPEYYIDLKVEKLRVLRDLGHGYQYLVLPLFALALVIHGLLLAQCLQTRRLTVEFLFGCVVLGGILSLVTMLTYVTITLWSVGRPLYSAYPLILLYISYMAASWQRYRAMGRGGGAGGVNHPEVQPPVAVR